MKYYSKQKYKTTAKPQNAPFTGPGRALLLSLAMIGLILVCTGCLGSTEQQGPQANKTTKTTQATIPAQLPQSLALTPSITPSKSPSNGSANSSHFETFAGNGVKKTTAFIVPKSWKIVWSCDLSSHNNTNYDLIIHANTTQNALLANSLETTCSKSHTHGEVTMNQAGKIYLIIISEGAWTVQVHY